MPTDGEPFRAELTAVGADWQITFTAGQKQRSIAAADLVAWGHCPEQGRGGTIVLADGGLLAAEVVSADQQRLTADCDSLGTLKIPLEALAGVVFRPPVRPATPRRAFRPPRPRRRRLFLPSPFGRGAGGEGRG